MSDVTDESLLIVGGGRRRGRPRVPEPLSVISVRVWVKHHDRLCEIAQQKDMSVSALVRTILESTIKLPH